MSKCRVLLSGALFLACFVLSGADKFQVSYITDAAEPKVRKATSLETQVKLFAERLSRTLRQQVKVVPFEKDGSSASKEPRQNFERAAF